MGRKNHKFPTYATWNVQTHLKSIEHCHIEMLGSGGVTATVHKSSDLLHVHGCLNYPAIGYSIAEKVCKHTLPPTYEHIHV